MEASLLLHFLYIWHLHRRPLSSRIPSQLLSLRISDALPHPKHCMCQDVLSDFASQKKFVMSLTRKDLTSQYKDRIPTAVLQ